jgi:DNA repair protein RadC
MKYNDLPRKENPHTRIRELGGPSLSNSEALALAFWLNDTETANQLAALYRECGGLCKIPRHRIMEIKGMGEKYADAIQAVVEIVRRELQVEVPLRERVHSPADIAALVRYEMGALENEELRVVLLNTRNEVIRIVTVVKGSMNGASVRIGELFREAIRENAAAVILLHNHPSGDPSPSPEDLTLTRVAIEAGNNLDIQVLDHIVIGGQARWVSIKERGLVSFK